MTTTVAIIGGGPSGLALARLLEGLNVDYVVYERDASADVVQQGGSLDLHPTTGQLVLERAGLKDQFEKYARRDVNVVLVDKQGKKLLEFDEGRESPEIDRVKLRSLLAASIPQEKIQWNKTVVSAERDAAGKVRIAFADGSTAAGFKLLVGADGAWSRIRPLVTSAKPVHSGRHYLEVRISKSNPFNATLRSKVGGGVIMAVGSGKHIAAQAMGDGSYRAYIAVTAPEEQFTNHTLVDLTAENGDVARRFFLSDPRYLADWGSEIKDIIANSEGPFRRWPLYHMKPEELNWAHVPGIALLGDAAHVSTPFVGEGANCALFDALQLADKIAQYGTTTDALELAVGEYEKDMFERGRSLIERSNESAGLIFAEDPAALVQVATEAKIQEGK